MRRWRRFALLVLAGALLVCCSRQEQAAGPARLQVMTTLFPLYDFARAVGGDRVQVQLLLPPGLEPHDFEPKPDDMVRIGKADLFVYASPVMEPWAAKLLKSLAGGKLLVVEAGEHARYLTATASGQRAGDREDHSHGAGKDPHIWLDLGNAALMVDAVADGLTRKDPANREFYLNNAAAYKKRLAELDSRFRQGLGDCRTRHFLSGGHSAFAYLAERYNLTFSSAYGVSADTEPTARTLMQLVEQLRSQGLRHVFSEELLSTRVAETVAREAGASILLLHGLHNISKAELDSGATFMSLMEQNLKNLRTGLECR